MKKCLLFFLLCAACDSPRNHRVLPDTSKVNKTQSELAIQQLGLTFEARWLEGPFGNVQQKGSMILFVYNKQKELTDLAAGNDLFFFATMPSMGHPLDQAGEFKKIDTGIYLNTAIRFNMPGDWLMEIYIVDLKNEVLGKAQWNESF